jgi:hypothetical protein
MAQPSQQHRQQQDQLLFTEADPKHFVTLTRTKDWRYVLINSHAKLSSEVRRSQLPAGLSALICEGCMMLPASHMLHGEVVHTTRALDRCDYCGLYDAAGTAF